MKVGGKTNTRPLDLKNMMLRCAKSLLDVGLGTILFLTATVGQAAGQKTPEDETVPSAQVFIAIPVAQVATQATEVSSFLYTLEKEFIAPSPEVEKIQKELPEARDRLELRFRRTMHLLQTQPEMVMLQSQRQVWEKNRAEMDAWLNRLNNRLTELNKAQARVADLQKVWGQTVDSARSDQAPEAIIRRIEGTLQAIEAAQSTLQTRRSAVLDIQVSGRALYVFSPGTKGAWQDGDAKIRRAIRR
jgi:hypothetical protein